MRGWAAGIALTAALLALASPARAGTYDVVSCGAPGGGGINRAWTAYVVGSPTSFNVQTQCGPDGSMVAESSSTAGGTASMWQGGKLRLAAPPGSRFTHIVIWRVGGKWNNDWDLAGRDATLNVVGGPFGETCSGFCNLGSPQHLGVNDFNRAEYAISTTELAWGVACGVQTCATSGGNPPVPLASMRIYGSIVTVEDTTPPALSVGGLGGNGGWVRPPAIAVASRDPVGVRSVRVLVDGRLATVLDSSCDYHLLAPCPGVVSRTLRVPRAKLSDGPRAVAVQAVDTAGNVRSVVRPVKIDGTPPTAWLRRARGRTIVVAVHDRRSGVRSGQILVRQGAREPFRALRTRLSRSRLTARLDRGRMSRADIRVAVSDAAGNLAQGAPVRMRITGARTGRRRVELRRGRLDVGFGRAVRLAGRLSLSAGRPLAHVPVHASAAVRRKGAKARPAGTTVTNRHGRFAIELPAGASRNVHLAFPGAAGALPVTLRVRLAVRASSTIQVSRNHLPGGGTVVFSGRVRRDGERLPEHGLILILQGHEQGRWRTFADTRSTRAGRWHVPYHFSGRPGTYPVRVKIRHQSGFPFELGYSRPVRVVVG